MKIGNLFSLAKSFLGRLRGTGDAWGTAIPLVRKRAEESAAPEEENENLFPAEPSDPSDPSVPSSPPETFPLPTIPALREKLVLGQSLEEEQSVRTTAVEIVAAHNEVPSQTERRSFTEEGMVTQTKDFFLRTAEGRFIKPADLHGGGRCSVCGGNTNKIFFCRVCRRALCFADAFPWQEGHLCPLHHRQTLFFQDTWTQEKKG